MPVPRIVVSILAAGLAFGTGHAAGAQSAPPAPVLRPDRIVISNSGDALEAVASRSCRVVTTPEANSRLLVYKDGVCVLARGLRNETRQDVAGRADVLEETGLIESGWVAADGRGGLVATMRYTDRVRLVEGGGAPADEGFRGITTLTWLDPSHPDGSFEIALEPGRVVKDAVALPFGFGIAVLTQVYGAPDADFRLYDLRGELSLRVPEREASAGGIVSTNSGGFIVVDLAHVAHPGLPDRALRVFDLLQGKWWDYTWSYGSPEEPLSWTILESGTLEVNIPGATKRYDRNGHALRGSGSGKKAGGRSRAFNRLRD